MCLLYLDDSGSAGNAAEDYFVLGGVSVFERQCYWLSQRLDELAATIAPDSPGAVEFHASEVFSGRSAPWKGLKDRTERRNMIARVLSVLAHAPGSTSAFACTVHKASFPNADPVEIAFEEICSRFDLQLSRFHSQGDTHRGIIILDRSADETSLRRLASSFRASGTKWGTLRNIAETPLFLESHASRLIQLADHVAYAVFRRYNAGDASYLDPVLHRFDAENGRIHGLIHRSDRHPDCLCPACMSRRLAR